MASSEFEIEGIKTAIGWNIDENITNDKSDVEEYQTRRAYLGSQSGIPLRGKNFYRV